MEYRETIFPANGFAVLHGIQEEATVVSPGAGQEWSYTVPGGYYRRLLTGTAKLTTSAAVANRNAGMLITGTKGTLLVASNSGNIVASSTPVICYTTGSTVATAGLATEYLALVFTGFWMPPGFSIGSHTFALDVADQYSNIDLLWECVDRNEMHKYIEPHGLDIHKLNLQVVGSPHA